MTERAQVVTPTEARQASARRLNFRVLVVSMVAAIAVAGMIYYAVYANPRSAIGVPDQPAATTEPAAPATAPDTPATPDTTQTPAPDTTP